MIAEQTLPSVGVVGLGPGCSIDLKREMLLFDRLATVTRTATMNHGKFGKSIFVRDQAEEDEFRQCMRDAEFLAKRGVVFPVNDFSVSNELRQDPLVCELQDQFSRATDEIWQDVPVGAIRTYSEIGGALARQIPRIIAGDCRLAAMKLRRLSGMDAYAVVPPESFVDIDKPATLGDVIQIVLGAIPLPSDATPMEQLMEFRSDSEARQGLRRLRRWMSGVVRSDLSVLEASQELDCLLDDHRRYMELHKLESRSGFLGAIVTAAPELIRHTLSLNLPGVIGSVTDVLSRRVQLMKAESEAPGREVAYLLKLEKAFGE